MLAKTPNEVAKQGLLTKKSFFTEKT